MDFLQFQQNPVWLNGVIFALAAAAVWFAGTRISGYASFISERTGMGKAFVGLILLGSITSLPEVAVVTSAAWYGNADLAVNNILGSFAMNVAILAAADVLLRRALTSITAQPVVLLQGTLDILLLIIVALGLTVGDVAILGVGAWTSALVVLYFLSVWMVKTYQHEPSWVPSGRRRETERQESADEGDDAGSRERSLGRVSLQTAAAGLVILVAGYTLSRTGDALAVQTGLGQSFMGVALVAIATSLPEVSTVFAAVRLQEFELAFADIFGTNFFNIALIFLIDAVYAGPPVLTELGRFSEFAALLGIAVTTIYLAGLIERRDRTVARMGYDSVAVLVVYLGGLYMLYTMR